MRRVLRRSRRRCLRQAEDECASRRSRGHDIVVAVRPVDRDRVGEQVACVATDRRREVDVDLDDVSRGKVVHRRRVRSTQRAQNDALGVVGVHQDVPRLAEEPQPPAVRGRVEGLPPGRAVEDHRVEAVSTLDHVASVTRIPDEAVVAFVEETGVVALVAVDDIVA